MNKKFTKFIVGVLAMVSAIPHAEAQTLLFTNGKENNIDIYWRIPSIVRMNDGALWAFTDKRYYSAKDLGDSDGKTPHQIEIYGRKSFDNGKSWGKAEVALQSNLNASGANEYLYAFGDAATVVDRESGSILMMAASGKMGVKANPTGQPFVTRSVFDTGKWSTSNVSDQFYGPNNLYGTTLFVTSGRMVQSTKYKKDKYYRIYAGVCMYSKSASYVVYSDDFGKTWQYLGGYVTAPVQDGDECKIEELPNGDIVLFTRKRSAKSGRYINVFKFTDIATGAGNWQTSANTGTTQTDGEAYAVANNGEVMLVPAQNREGKQTYVLLLSGPIVNDRSKVHIFWKELPTDYSNPESYVSGWNKYQVNNGNFWGYTTMVPDRNGDIAFMSEMSQYAGPISFISLPLSTITNGEYTYHRSAKGTYHTTSEPVDVQRPSLSLNGGVYTTAQTVTITKLEGSTVYYTLDGSDPVVPVATSAEAKGMRRVPSSNTTSVYTNPIELTSGATTLKAVAVDDYSGNVSPVVTASYLITDANNNSTVNTSKTGTTISLDHNSATNLFTNNGSGRFWSYLRHNSTHIQLISSTVAELEDGQQGFHILNNNMVWDSNNLLALYNGRLNGGAVQQYGHYAILAPKGYRFLRYEIVMDKTSENGAKLEQYTYQNGSNTEITVVNSATASSSAEVTLERTLTDGTNALYFRMDGQTASDQYPIIIKSLKLTYAIDNSYAAQVPNANGSQIHTGFIDLGTFSKPKGNNYGFSNNGTSDLQTVNVKNTYGIVPQNVTVDGSNYFMATANGDYYVEAPAKFRIIGATVNFKRAESTSFDTYIPSETTQGVNIVLRASDNTDNYFKIDDSGSVSNVTSRDQATVFTVDYHTGSGENHYSLKLPNGKYLAMDANTNIVTLDNVDQALWSYNSGWKFPYKNNTTDYRFIGAVSSGYSWGAQNYYKNSAIAYRMPLTASDFTATVYNREDNGTATDGEKSLTADAPTQSIMVSDFNNDAIHINLSGITSGSAALFNVELTLLPLDPEVAKVEAAVKVGSDVVGNSPVTSYNYVFNEGKTIGVPVPSTTNKDADITMVFRNATNEEQTLWYTTGNNQNNPNVKGGYSNVYLIASTADKDKGLNITSPYPNARTAVDELGVNKISATNIAQLADEKNTSVNNLQNNTVTASDAGYTDVTMTLNTPSSTKTTDGNTFYIYSADQPTYQIMPGSIAQGKHIDFRFFTVSVKPVVAETPNIEIVPIYTTTMKGALHKTSTASDGDNTANAHYVGIKVTAQQAEGTTTSYNALTAEDIYTAMKQALVNKKDELKISDSDPLRTVLYVDMSALSTVTTANSTTMANYLNETADNCLYFMPQGFAGTGMGNVISKQSDGTYQSFGDVRVYDQQPFFSPYAFNTGTYKAIYEREGTVRGETVKAKVRNMAAVLPFDIQLDSAGHPYLDGSDQATNYITFNMINGSGNLTGVKKDSEGHPLTYAVLASPVTTQVASANNPYYVSIDENHDAGFTFIIPGAQFASSGTINDTYTTVTLAALTLANTDGTWTAYGTYSGGAQNIDPNLWYFSKDLFWKSSQLAPDYAVVNVRPFRAWYTTTTKTTAAKAAVVFDKSDLITTGIHDLDAVSANTGKIFTVDGRYVGTDFNNLAPGLYIQNGRKVVKR